MIAGLPVALETGGGGEGVRPLRNCNLYQRATFTAWNWRRLF